MVEFLCYGCFKLKTKIAMKKKTTIITITYVVFCIAVCWGALQYVEKKDERLREEAKEKLDNFINGHSKIVNVVYSGKNVNYEKAEIPESNDYWWDDIDRLYELSPQSNGWCLRIMEFSKGGLDVYKLYPYMVGFIYTMDWYNSPSIQTAVDEAYEYLTTNEYSEYKDYIDNGFTLYDLEKIADNEYYTLYSYDWHCEKDGQEYVHALWSKSEYIDAYYGKGHVYSVIGKRVGGYVHTNYYRVYNMLENEYHFSLIYNAIDDPKRKDLITFMAYSCAILTIAFLGYLIPHLIVRHRKRKRRRELLKAKLLRVSNPKNFMKPYDEAKVNAANEIFARLQQLSPDDEASLKEVRKQITTELGVSFIDQDALTALKEKCNPERFMRPYDEAKVKLANLLYAKLQSPTLSIEEFEHVQQEYESTLK